MVSEPISMLSLCLLTSATQKVHSRVEQPRHKPIFPPVQVRGTFSWYRQHVSVFHLSPSFLLLRLSSRFVKPRGESSLLLPYSHLWDRGSTLSIACQIYWSLIALLGLKEWGFYNRKANQGDQSWLCFRFTKSSVYKVGMPLPKKCTKVLLLEPDQ